MKAGGELSEIRRQYAREAARYDRHWSRYLERTLGPTLAELERPGGLEGLRVLDAGCGTGLLLERILERWPAVEAYGVDLSAEMLARARARLPASVALLQGDVQRLPVASGRFDVVLSTSSLHHWRDPERAVAEIARVLRPGGVLVLTDWSSDFAVLRLFSRLLPIADPSHHRSYTGEQARRLLERAGLRVESLRRFRAGWLWGMMTLRASRR